MPSSQTYPSENGNVHDQPWPRTCQPHLGTSSHPPTFAQHSRRVSPRQRFIFRVFGSSLSTTRSAITYVRTLRIATGTRHGTACSTNQLGNRNFDECDQTCKILQKVCQFKTKTLSLTEFRKPRSPEPVPEGNFSRGESQS